MPSPSHEMALARTAAEAIFASDGDSGVLAGAVIRVAMSGIENSGQGRVKDAILIAGPTASGKSRLALDLALSTGGIVVNADSMQVYSVLNVLTARPEADDLARAPHALYGHVSPAEAYSTGRWLRDVGALLERPDLARPFIFVGGTGLYFRALVEGISDMPDIPAAIRDRWRQRLRDEGAPSLHAVLARDDPRAAATLKATDSQRVVRALEVLEASGRSILDWQGKAGAPLIDSASTRHIVIEPDRQELVARIDRRFDGMIAAGALDEVRALLALGLDPALPAMKASDTARQGCDAAICKAAVDLVPKPAWTAMAANTLGGRLDGRQKRIEYPNI